MLRVVKGFTGLYLRGWLKTDDELQNNKGEGQTYVGSDTSSRISELVKWL
jgi:hypothetical protein